MKAVALALNSHPCGVLSPTLFPLPGLALTSYDGEHLPTTYFLSQGYVACAGCVTQS